MANGIYAWLDSGENVHSCYRNFVEWRDLGITEEEWDMMTEKEQEKLAREIAFEQSDWGFEKADGIPKEYR